jgi:hypothetical protein
MIQDKAQFAVNGYSLNKDCNAVLNHLWVSLRAQREAVIWRCRLRAPTLGASLGKDQPFPARRALQLTTSHHADMYHLYVTPH